MSKTKVEYEDKLIPMDKDMEHAVVKGLGLDNKDECLLTALDVLRLFKDYKEKKNVLPTQWVEYMKQVLSQTK